MLGALPRPKRSITALKRVWRTYWWEMSL